MVVPRASTEELKQAAKDDGLPALHRIYVRAEGDPRKIIGWLYPTATGWRFVVLKGAWKLRVLANGYVPKSVAKGPAITRAEAVATVRREWAVNHNQRIGEAA